MPSDIPDSVHGSVFGPDGRVRSDSLEGLYKKFSDPLSIGRSAARPGFGFVIALVLTGIVVLVACSGPLVGGGSRPQLDAGNQEIVADGNAPIPDSELTTKEKELALKSEKADRDRTVRTMADLRTLAFAVGCYAIDNNHYPRGVTKRAQLKRHIIPFYLRRMPSKDGWGTPYNLYTSSGGDHYTIESYGKDRIRQGCTVGTETTNPDCDICHSNGMFVQWPAFARELRKAQP